MPEKKAYQFGPFAIDTQQRRLTRDGADVPLAPKVVDTLLVLIASPGRILQREEMIEAIWPDTKVEGGGLDQNIAHLRRALGDGAKDGRYIETIHRLGYRFLMRVIESKVENHAQRTGLAILPLKMLSNDPAQEPFCEGMNEALITSLAEIRALRVYQAADDGVGSLTHSGMVELALKGACLLIGSAVRITIRVVRAGNGEQVWAKVYEEEIRDIVELQGRVARDVVTQIQVQVTPEESQRLARTQVVNPEAYQAYLEGRFWWNRRTVAGLIRSIDHFNLAITKDPMDGRAYSGLADAYIVLASTPYNAQPPKDLFPRAAKFAERALEMDSSLAEARVSRAFIKLQFEWDALGAELEFRQAIELNPGYATARHWHAHALIALGRLDEALAEMTRAQELDSRSLVIASGIAWRHYCASEFDRAIVQCRKALERDPNFVVLLCTLGRACEQSGQNAEAVAVLERAAGLAPSNPNVLAALGHAQALLGNHRQARLQLDRLTAASATQYVPAILFAFLYEGLKQRETALDWLEKAREERSDYMMYLKIDPAFASLHADARFGTLMAGMGE